MSRFPCLAAALLAGLLWLAPLHASAMTVAEMCAGFGELTESTIRVRDRGVPLSTTMKLVDKVNAEHPNTAGHLRSWMVLFVYDMSSYTETSWIRNRAELKCFQTFQQ
jgi:hypothetical protein